MIEKISGYCKNTWNFVYEQGYSVYELILKVLQKQDEIIDEVNDLEEFVGGFDQRISQNTSDIAENADDIDDVEILAENNRDQLQYLTNQFSDGQTGLVIDGGFFQETGIKKNYNGGIF